MGFALAHPSGGIEREYVARVAGQITARGLRSLRHVIELEDGFARPRSVRKVRFGAEDWGVRLRPGGRPKAGGAGAAEGGGASGGGTRTHALRPLPSGKTEARHLEAGAHIGTCGGARPDPARGPRPVASLEEMEWLS